MHLNGTVRAWLVIVIIQLCILFILTWMRLFHAKPARLPDNASLGFSPPIEFLAGCASLQEWALRGSLEQACGKDRFGLLKGYESQPCWISGFLLIKKMKVLVSQRVVRMLFWSVGRSAKRNSSGMESVREALSEQSTQFTHQGVSHGKGSLWRPNRRILCVHFDTRKSIVSH